MPANDDIQRPLVWMGGMVGNIKNDWKGKVMKALDTIEVTGPGGNLVINVSDLEKYRKKKYRPIGESKNDKKSDSQDAPEGEVSGKGDSEAESNEPKKLTKSAAKRFSKEKLVDYASQNGVSLNEADYETAAEFKDALIEALKL